VRCFYHPDYFMPLPSGHPFPMEKFPDAYDLVKDRVEVYPPILTPSMSAKITLL
jgi:hypothetical protein